MDKKSVKREMLQAYPGLCLLILGLIMFQVIWNFYMHEPYRNTDITMETVQTILKEGFSYQTNPMTGGPYTAGAPMRWKVLVLPYLYAGVCQVTGLSPQILVYAIVPTIVLLLSYGVYYGLGGYLFQDNIKRKLLFLLLVAMIYQFGSYTTVSESFLLFHSGYEGTSIRAAVLLPLTLLSALKKQWWLTALCILAEAATVWTFFGLGYTALTAGVVALVHLVALLQNRRKTA